MRQLGNLQVVIVKDNDLELRSRMLRSHVLVNVIGLLAPHLTVGTLEPGRTPTLELKVSQHVMQVLVAPFTLWTCIPAAGLACY